MPQNDLRSLGLPADTLAIIESQPWPGAATASPPPATGDTTTVPPASSSPSLDANPADAPDATYPKLSARQVTVLRALQIPDSMLQTFATSAEASRENAETIIQSAVQYPDEFDDSFGRPRNTTRQLLAQIPAALLQPPAGQSVPQPPTTPTSPEGPTGPQPPTTPTSPGADVPDAQYPGLATTHANFLRQVGTPAARLEMISSYHHPPAAVAEKIQAIIRDPEGWDRICGNPEGTTRRALETMGYMIPPGDGAGKTKEDNWTHLIVGAAVGVALLGIGLWAYNKFIKKPLPPVVAGGPPPMIPDKIVPYKTHLERTANGGLKMWTEFNLPGIHMLEANGLQGTVNAARAAGEAPVRFADAVTRAVGEGKSAFTGVLANVVDGMPAAPVPPIVPGAGAGVAALAGGAGGAAAGGSWIQHALRAALDEGIAIGRQLPAVVPG